jgi:hypothetical protein
MLLHEQGESPRSSLLFQSVSTLQRHPLIGGTAQVARGVPLIEALVFRVQCTLVSTSLWRHFLKYSQVLPSTRRLF